MTKKKSPKQPAPKRARKPTFHEQVVAEEKREAARELAADLQREANRIAEEERAALQQWLDNTNFREPKRSAWQRFAAWFIYKP